MFQGAANRDGRSTGFLIMLRPSPADHSTLSFPEPGAIKSPGAGKYVANKGRWGADCGKAAFGPIAPLNWPESKPWKIFSMDCPSRPGRSESSFENDSTRSKTAMARPLRRDGAGTEIATTEIAGAEVAGVRRHALRKSNKV